MAKPPILDLPPAWGDAGNYPAGVYSALLPWGAANPLAGQPLPWGNQPRLNATALTAFASAGAEPQVPQDASSMNEWLRRVQVHVAWVQDGSSAADATAHIMETTGAGLSRAVAYEATAGYQGAGATPAIMLMGFTVPAGETSTFGDNTTLVGTNTTIATVGEINFLSGGGPLSSVGLGVNAGGELFFGTSRRVHSSPQGYVYATGDQESETALQATVTACTTTQSVTGVAAGNVRVIVEGWGQRATLGNVEITVQQDQGTATWIDIGSIQTVQWLDTSNANLWSYYRHERVVNIGTSTATFFRAKIDAQGGSTSKIRESHLRAVSERF